RAPAVPLSLGIHASPSPLMPDGTSLRVQASGRQTRDLPRSSSTASVPELRRPTVMTSATLETQNTETGGVTGTADKDYNIIWFLQQCLSNVLRLEIYIHDAERAEDQELAEFFRRAQAESRKGAEKGTQLLRERIC